MIRLPHIRLAGLLICAFTGVAVPGTAQVLRVDVPPDSVVQQVELVDGSRLYGRFVDASDPATFRLASGSEMSIPLGSIRSVTRVGGRLRGAEYWPMDPNRTRLFFGPTGRTLPKGSGYLSVFELFIPFVAGAPTDDLLLAGGTPLAPDAIGRIFWLAPKLRVVDREALDVSIGVLSIFGPDFDESFGILYGTGTWGSDDDALTAGLGFGYYDRSLGDRPVVMIGGEVRVARSVKLVSENWIFPEGVGFVSGGVRFIGERLSADLGILNLVGDADDDGGYWLPLVSFVWNW